MPIKNVTPKGRGVETDSVDQHPPIPERALLALLFPPGGRPSIDDVRLAGEAAGAFAVSYAPQSPEGWAELLITGLTFEIVGLIPGSAQPRPRIAHHFGETSEWRDGGFEVVELRPGAHLAGAAAMLPVVRGCVVLGTALAGSTGAVGLVWIPAASLMAADYFAAAVVGWLNGSPFPALGLTALASGEGCLSS
ncbi:hypothetical protein [Novosphingobium sp. Gsoil 351]|uniref:hypothetical protein n=1 Tax=Novosphingobium sp. Gsoil 351 TaxID=2675225 RepID=UPI0012B4AD1E|nr:hypothetical protein [Novosphingobium sp. Gsoil 351]QGN53379.1 hypothetical protein GKE62_01235 [Novosphingobium sp. Gsoil 351]